MVGVKKVVFIILLVGLVISLTACDTLVGEAYRRKPINLQIMEVCDDGQDNDKDNLIDCEDSDCCKGICVNVNGRCEDLSNTKAWAWANEFQGVVYNENKVLDLVDLHELEGDGTLNGGFVKVVNYCEDSTGKGIINSPNNIFVYNPLTEKLKFDQVSAYYYGYESINFYSQFADILGWKKLVSNNEINVEITHTLKISLCDPSAGPGKGQGGGWGGGISYPNKIVLSCYSIETCSNIGASVNDICDLPPEIESKGISLSLFLHEYTHDRYMDLCKLNEKKKKKDSGEWWHLNEAYASFIPRMYFSSGSVSENGDLNNDYEYGKNYDECDYEDIIDEEDICYDPDKVQGKIDGCKNDHDISAIGGALWDFSEKIKDNTLSAELVIRSWKYLHKFDDNYPAPVAARLALIEASKKKYGEGTDQHQQTKNRINTAFSNHITIVVGVVTEI